MLGPDALLDLLRDGQEPKIAERDEATCHTVLRFPDGTDLCIDDADLLTLQMAGLLQDLEHVDET